MDKERGTGCGARCRKRRGTQIKGSLRLFQRVALLGKIASLAASWGERVWRLGSHSNLSNNTCYVFAQTVWLDISGGEIFPFVRSSIERSGFWVMGACFQSCDEVGTLK